MHYVFYLQSSASEPAELLPLLSLELERLLAKDTSRYIKCARAPITTARMITAVRAAFIPETTVLLTQTTESNMIAAITIVIHMAEAFPCPFTQVAIRSWLKAIKMNGIETAPDILTIFKLVLGGMALKL